MAPASWCAPRRWPASWASCRDGRRRARCCARRASDGWRTGPTTSSRGIGTASRPRSGWAPVRCPAASRSGSGQARSAVGRQLSLVLLQAFRDPPFPGLHVLAERLRVGATSADRLPHRSVGLGHTAEELAALGGDLVLVLLHALAALGARLHPGTELLRVCLAGLRTFAELRDPRLAGLRELLLVFLQARGDAPLPGLHAGAELLRIVQAGVLRGLGEQNHEQKRHGSTFASERMLSVIEGSCGTDAISRLSASPMPGRCAPASSLGGAASS